MNVATHIDRQTDTEHLLTPEEVQQRLRCGRDALREQCRRGMPCVRLGMRRRFCWGDVLAWLRERERNIDKEHTQ